MKEVTGPEVAVANGDTITLDFQANLPMSKTLSPRAQKVYIFEYIRTGSLISLGQLYDDDCIAIFSKYEVDIIEKDTVIL